MAQLDEWFMREALKEAKKAEGQTSPNPAVGAVLVIDNHIVARGHHRGAGHDHAEIECLRNFGASVPARATLYITLEPCSTVGLTAPCTDAILKAGITKAVVGAVDVNPRHHGRGITRLRDAGIKVREGVLAEDCAHLNEAFNKWIVSRQPFVIAKCGMSLLIGAETVRVDNPRLTVRGVHGARQPWRVVLTRSTNLPRRARLFSDRWAGRTLIYKGKSLASVLKDLGKRSVTSVLIEGGGEVLGQALDARLIDKVQIYLGPILTGGPLIAFPGRGAQSTGKATPLREVSYWRIGENVCITAYPKENRR